jgi:hypothetical protein
MSTFQEAMMDTDILRRCYAAFNARDLEGALATMHPEVHWPNGWEGGWVEGREADEMVEHVYQVQDGLVRQMDIRK